MARIPLPIDINLTALKTAVKKGNLEPWQGTFIRRVANLMRHFNLSKKSIGEFESKGSKYLREGARMSRFTLSNYLDFEKEGGAAIVSVQNLLILCELFNCSPNYLLGYDECRDSTNSAIHNLTGLSEEAINLLKRKNALINLPNYVEFIHKGEDANGKYLQPMFLYHDDNGNVKTITYAELSDKFKNLDPNALSKPAPGFFNVLSELITYNDGQLINDLYDYIKEDSTVFENDTRGAIKFRDFQYSPTPKISSALRVHELSLVKELGKFRASLLHTRAPHVEEGPHQFYSADQFEDSAITEELHRRKEYNLDAADNEYTSYYYEKHYASNRDNDPWFEIVQSTEEWGRGE